MFLNSADFVKFCLEVHNNNVEKGFWDTPRTFAHCCALMHSELSEAFDAVINDYPPSKKIDGVGNYEEEIADLCIRIADYLGYVFKEDNKLSETFVVPMGVVMVTEGQEGNLVANGEDHCKDLLALHMHLSNSLEAERKNKRNEMIDLLCNTFFLSLNFNSGLDEVINKKIEYNKSRAYKHGKAF